VPALRLPRGSFELLACGERALGACFGHRFIYRPGVHSSLVEDAGNVTFDLGFAFGRFDLGFTFDGPASIFSFGTNPLSAPSPGVDSVTGTVERAAAGDCVAPGDCVSTLTLVPVVTLAWPTVTLGPVPG
jgi:hypothetical protein